MIERSIMIRLLFLAPLIIYLLYRIVLDYFLEYHGTKSTGVVIGTGEFGGHSNSSEFLAYGGIALLLFNVWHCFEEKHYVRYHFTHKGTRYYSFYRLPYEMCRRYGFGDTLEVTYWSPDPRVNRPSEASHYAMEKAMEYGKWAAVIVTAYIFLYFISQ